MATMENFGQRIRRLREGKELSRPALGKLMGRMAGKDLEVSGEAIRLYETCKNQPSERTRRALALALGVTEAYLLFGDENSRSGPADPLMSQLMVLYSGLSSEGKFELLGYANRLYVREHPQASVFNPYPDAPKPLKPRLVKK